MKSYIDDIMKIEPLSRVDPVKNAGEVKPLKEATSGPLFNDLLLENIKNNKVNKGVLPDQELFPREKLKQLAEMIQLQLKSSLLSQMNDSEEDESSLNMPMPFLSLPDKSSLIDSLASNIKQTQPGLKETKPAETQKTEINAANSRPVEQVINAASNEYDVDPDLIRSVIRAESDSDPLSTSPKGAMGLMQLMPETAKELGVNDPYDIFENVMGGTRYLKTLLDRYSGNKDLALAAYNWGMGNVERNPEGLPRETRDYIAKINKFLRSSKA